MEAGECAFCKIIAGDIPSKKVYEDEEAFAFLDINPRNPGHTLVIPKKHYDTLFDVPAGEAGKLFEVVKKIAAAVKSGVKADGVSISQSNSRAAGQLVPHLHFHVIPRFNNEGPIGLEGVLQVKKMDEESTDKVVEEIQKNLEAKPAEEKKEEPDEPLDLGEEEKSDISFEDF